MIIFLILSVIRWDNVSYWLHNEYYKKRLLLLSYVNKSGIQIFCLSMILFCQILFGFQFSMCRFSLFYINCVRYEVKKSDVVHLKYKVYFTKDKL